jgi:hypothetical protein
MRALPAIAVSICALTFVAWMALVSLRAEQVTYAGTRSGVPTAERAVPARPASGDHLKIYLNRDDTGGAAS